MAEMRYSVTTPERLRQLCIEQGWFTGGSNEQYEKMFTLNEEKKPIAVIAGVIWLCSHDDLPTIQNILEEERDTYLKQMRQSADTLFALRLRTIEENTFVVKAENLEEAKGILKEAYDTGQLNMDMKTSEYRVEIFRDPKDQAYIDTNGTANFVILE